VRIPVIRRNIESGPVSDMGVINITYKCQTIAYADPDGGQCNAQFNPHRFNGEQEMIQQLKRVAV